MIAPEEQQSRRVELGLRVSGYGFRCIVIGVILANLTSCGLCEGATNFASAVVAAGPVAYWRLNEASSGTSAHDSVGSYDGTNHELGLAAPEMVPPPTFVGPAANQRPYGFSGPSSFVQTPLRLAGNQGTFLALINPDGGQVSAAAICVGVGVTATAQPWWLSALFVVTVPGHEYLAKLPLGHRGPL